MGQAVSFIPFIAPLIGPLLQLILKNKDQPPVPAHAPPPEELPRPDWLPEGVNWAVCGHSGVGKSSFINALRGLKPTDPGAAAVGVTETTVEPRSFEFEGSPVRLWDLPGCGTVKFPMSKYVVQFGLRFMAGVVIMTSTRATTAELEIMQLCEEYHIPWYYVRSKVDVDIANNDEDYGIPEEQTLSAIRKELVDNMQKVPNSKGLSASRVYVLSSRGKKGDWKSFATDLAADLKTTFSV